MEVWRHSVGFPAQPFVEGSGTLIGLQDPLGRCMRAALGEYGPPMR